VIVSVLASSSVDRQWGQTKYYKISLYASPTHSIVRVIG
jgi:hypothetical protein